MLTICDTDFYFQENLTNSIEHCALNTWMSMAESP